MFSLLNYFERYFSCINKVSVSKGLVLLNETCKYKLHKDCNPFGLNNITINFIKSI